MTRDPRDAPVPNPVDLMRAVTALRRSVALYPRGHAVIGQTLDELMTVLEDAFHDRDELRVEVVGGVAHAAGYPFRVESRAHRQVLEELDRCGIQCLEIERGAGPEELVATVMLLHELGESAEGVSLRERLAERGVRHVRLTRLAPVDLHRHGYGWPEEPAAILGTAYRDALDAAREAVSPVFEGGAMNLQSIERLLARVMALVDDSQALGQILAVKRYENHTFCHSVNVAALALLLGRRLGLDAPGMTALAEGALLHDVGKRRVPKEILCKAGPLSRREWRVMRRHPVAGAEILVSIPGLGPLTPTIALEHHCGYDGGGYPELNGAAPHPISRLVAVADTYEALTGARPYREPLLPEEACLVLARMAGEKLDPILVRAFVGLITFFPLGSVVRTDRGEVGVVVEAREQEPLHPVIALVDVPVAPGPERRIDTAERDAAGRYLRHVVETLPSSVVDVEPEARAESA